MLAQSRRAVEGCCPSLMWRTATYPSASKLYISAHSARESIAAYRKYGCINAEEINEALAEKEPCGLQLEFQL